MTVPRYAMRSWLLVFLLCFEIGCAGTQGPSAKPSVDPWEKFNRPMFAFNEALDRWAVAPVAKGWDYVAPDALQMSIKNVFDNIWMPAVFVNHLLQARFKEAFAEDLPRFLINTTVGWAGLFDVASMEDIDKNYTDFGVTLGRWGTPTGPFLMLPLLGPSSVRNSVGKAVDAYSTPYFLWIPIWSSIILRATQMVNLRAVYAEELDEAKAESFDYYLFVRNAWIQNRQHRVLEARGEEASPAFDESEVDLYYFDYDTENLTPEESKIEFE